MDRNVWITCFDGKIDIRRVRPEILYRGDKIDGLTRIESRVVVSSGIIDPPVVEVYEGNCG
jgi:hypothetical protein